MLVHSHLGHRYHACAGSVRNSCGFIASLRKKYVLALLCLGASGQTVSHMRRKQVHLIMFDTTRYTKSLSKTKAK